MVARLNITGRAKAVGAQKADRGLAVGCLLSPHPGLLPRGEGRRFAAGVELESGSHPSRRRSSCPAGSVSPSPRGKAGVRGKGAWPAKRLPGLPTTPESPSGNLTAHYQRRRTKIILPLLMFSPFCIGAPPYPPPGEWQPDLLGWHVEDELQAQPAPVASRPTPDFDKADSTRYIEVLDIPPHGQQIGCFGII